MTLAITVSLGVLIGAFALAITLGWRRYGTQPASDRTELLGTSCYPSVPRNGRARQAPQTAD